jgi:hypothetical protein
MVASGEPLGTDSAAHGYDRSGSLDSGHHERPDERADSRGDLARPPAESLVRRYQQGRSMLKHWLIDLIGHVSGLSDAQLRQIEKSLPATKALIDLLNRAQPIIEQAQNLYAEAEPLIDQAKKEWQTVGPAAQILIDVISHHVNKGSSPAEAAEAVRTALDGSIKSVAQDHWMGSRNKLRNGVRRDWLYWSSRRAPFARVRRHGAYCLTAS